MLRPENLGETLFTAGEWQAIATTFGLSDRELAVTTLLVEGRSREEIADHLQKPDGSHVSIQTVRIYIARVFEKMSVKDRFGLVLRLVHAHREIHGAIDASKGKRSLRRIDGPAGRGRRGTGKAGGGRR